MAKIQFHQLGMKIFGFELLKIINTDMVIVTNGIKPKI